MARSKSASLSRATSLCPKADLLVFEEVGLRASWVIGLDEVGMGCLAGPVVAACFAYRAGADHQPAEQKVRITDSKKLSEEQRVRAHGWLETLDDTFRAVHSASPAEIDAINILRASQLAMERAFADVWTRLEPLLGEAPAALLIDGNKVPAFVRDASRPWAGRLRGACLIKGDGRSYAIAAASILAKQRRDTWMRDLDAEFPGYGWSTNVGYPTPPHKAAIVERGFTPWHRRSFRVQVDGQEFT